MVTAAFIIAVIDSFLQRCVTTSTSLESDYSERYFSSLVPFSLIFRLSFRSTDQLTQNGSEESDELIQKDMTEQKLTANPADKKSTGKVTKIIIGLSLHSGN